MHDIITSWRASCLSLLSHPCLAWPCMVLLALHCSPAWLLLFSSRVWLQKLISKKLISIKAHLLCLAAAEHSEDLLLQRLAQQGSSGGGAAAPSSTAAGGGSGAGDDSTALVRAADMDNLMRQIVWNQNRLAVPALLVPPGELLRRGLLHPSYRLQFAGAGSLAAEPLLFLPVADIPTLKRRRRLIMPPHTLPALTAAPAPVPAAALPQQLPALPAAAAVAVEAAAAAAVAAGMSALPPVAGGNGAAAAVTTAGTALGSSPDSMDVDAPSGSADAQQGSSSLLQPETQGGADGGSSAAAMQSQEGDAAAAAAAAGVDSSQCQPLASEQASEETEQPRANSTGQPEQEQQEHRQVTAAEKRGAVAAPPALPEDEGEDMVEGLLLVSARTALMGRMPLNGTYFQARLIPSLLTPGLHLLAM